MDLHEVLIVAVAGLAAGLINGVVGGASLMTFPVLVATGLAPVQAAVTNTVGIGGANVFALIPHRKSMAWAFTAWRRGAMWTAIGAAFGAFLLLALPARVFELVVPVFVFFATLAMMRRLPEHEPDGGGHPHTNTRLGLAGIYSGYFGSGMGIIAMAILANDGRLDMRGVSVVKNYVIAVANTVATIYFLPSGETAWAQAGILFVTSATGGYLSGKLLDRLNQKFLRSVVVAVGLIATVYLTIRLF